MKCTFLGTGTSMGVPVAGGFGSDRIDGDPRNQRYRCSVWLQTGDTSIVIDTGPEFRLQTIRSGIKKIDLVLITHEHMDHIAGLDDLRAFNYVQKSSIPLYTSSQAARSIRQRFSYMFGPQRYPGSSNVDIVETSDPFTFGNLSITPLCYNHGAITVQGYRIGDFSYMTDVKSVPPETRKKIEGSKVLVLSGLRWAPEHPTHLTIPEAVEFANSLDIPKTYLIHMNSYVNHKETNEKLPDHVKLAYDMLEITLPG
ncbi:MAG: MBL fold metallo-hydrolase [Bacteroidetes bacterium]|nr:MBL fold metallo-hydrolase [Bacteroidota bacterium]